MTGPGGERVATAWQALPRTEALARLGGTPEGLTGVEAAAQAQTRVVNATLAMEMGCLFAARQSRQPGFSAEGFRGTPAI